MKLTLVHGWGYDRTLWREVLPLLTDYEVEVADLGFFGTPALPIDGDAPRIAVGHSLGAIWWLALAGLPWTRLVAINGFARFTAAPDFAAGVAPRVLERMRKRFATAPAATLSDFQQAAGGTGPALPGDTSALEHGLATLAEADGRQALAQRPGNIYALAGRQDAIVPAAMSAATFAALPASRLQWVEGGGHLLPLSHPRECAALIRAAASG